MPREKGSSVDLSRWSLDGGGALSLVADKIKAGPAATMDLQAVYGDKRDLVAGEQGDALYAK